jgi:hypothetical protein
LACELAFSAKPTQPIAHLRLHWCVDYNKVSIQSNGGNAKVYEEMNIISSPLPSPVTSATTSMDALQDALQLVEKKSWDALIDQVNATPSLASMVASSPWSNGSQGNLIMHEACKQQPSVGVIEALLQACPDAARTRGRWGYLPLHYA